MNIRGLEDNVATEVCRKQLNELEEKKEFFWRQRSKSLWLKERDRNTRYFHAMTTSRKRNNMILKIMDERNRWHDKGEEIEDVFVRYFTSIYTTSNPHDMEFIL